MKRTCHQGGVGQLVHWPASQAGLSGLRVGRKGVSDRKVVVGESSFLLKCGGLLPDPAVM